MCLLLVLPSGPNNTAVYPDSVDLSGYDIDGFRDVAIKAGWEEVSLGIFEGLIKFSFCSDRTAPTRDISPHAAFLEPC